MTGFFGAKFHILNPRWLLTAYSGDMIPSGRGPYTFGVALYGWNETSDGHDLDNLLYADQNKRDSSNDRRFVRDTSADEIGCKVIAGEESHKAYQGR